MAQRDAWWGDNAVSGFEFIFSLFGLLLGLALAEGLSGLSRSIKASPAVRIGWPTALLGIFVVCDVVTFWMYGWTLRDVLPLNWPTLFGGFVVTAIYYVSASLIFPDDPDGWGDLDRHFDKHRRKVLIGILLCNIALLATATTLGGTTGLDLRSIVLTWSFFPLSLVAILSNDRRVIMGCLV